MGEEMKPSGIGGMAVMEGVMMKNKEEYAVAVRKPDNEIEVKKGIYNDFSNKVKLFKLPIFRGMLAFVDSLVIGIKALNFSASFFDEDDSQTRKAKAEQNHENKETVRAKKQNKKTDIDLDIELEDAQDDQAKSTAEVDKKKDSKSDAIMTALVVILSTCLSICLFMVLPAFIIELVRKVISNHYVLTLIEGVIRLGIFIGYVALVLMMTEIKRVFMYHGAEHKTINCIENGFELTVENVRWQSKQHKRCGTSFLFLVMLISILIFMILPPLNLLWRVITRILLVPVIAGISYEFIRLAGRSDSPIVNIISKPGLWMQRLTTMEPDDAMIEVAIKSVEAVFDWRAFLEDYKESTAKVKPNSSKKQKSNENMKAEKVARTASNRAKATNESYAANNNDKSETAAAKEKTAHDIKRRANVTPISVKKAVVDNNSDEDDEILLALDKYFDNGSKEQSKLKK